MSEVSVEEYNPEWPKTFQILKTRLEGFLQNVPYLSIEHVGSTSVPGLAAKSVIDIDIVAARENLDATIKALTTNGEFEYFGELDIADRHVFADPDQSPRRNTYVCIEGSSQLRNHLAVRDVLRTNPELREEYGRVKMDLSTSGLTMDDYTAAKSTIIQKILLTSGILTAEELAAINDANVKKDRIRAFKTKRLLLREFTRLDIDGYYELEGSEENARFQDWAPRRKEEARDLVVANIMSSAEEPRRIWELAVECDTRFIGRVGAKLTRHDETAGDEERLPHFDLWFSFLPSVHRKGYATEAMSAFIDELVKRQDGKKVELEIECDPRNTGSWKLAERLGFGKFSLTERAWESKGEWVDSLIYRKNA